VDNFIKATTTFEEVDAIVTGAIIGAGQKNDGIQNIRLKHNTTIVKDLKDGKLGGAATQLVGALVREADPNMTMDLERNALKATDHFKKLWQPKAKAAASEMQVTFRAKKANCRTCT
jgi:hypothetical protein